MVKDRCNNKVKFWLSFKAHMQTNKIKDQRENFKKEKKMEMKMEKVVDQDQTV